MKKTLLFGLLLLTTSLCLRAQEITINKQQKSLVTKRTATWCPNCGQSDVWPMVKNLDTNLSGKAIVLAGHHSTASTLHRTVAKDFIDNFETAFSQPIFYFNRERIGGGGTGSSTETTLMERVDNSAQLEPIAQSGMVVRYDVSQRLLEINGKAEFYQSTTGNYSLGYYLVRKSVIAAQSNQSNEAEHMNVLWEALTENSFGDPLTGADFTAGSSFTLRKEYTLPEDLNIDNLMIVAILWKQSEDGEYYDLVNIESTEEIEFGVVSQVPQHTELTNFSIQPTISNTLSQAIIQLDAPIRQAEISIFNENGQKVKTIFRGTLTKGRHQFDLPIDGVGQYWVTLFSEKKVTSRRLIKIQ